MQTVSSTAMRLATHAGAPRVGSWPRAPGSRAKISRTARRLDDGGTLPRFVVHFELEPLLRQRVLHDALPANGKATGQGALVPRSFTESARCSIRRIDEHRVRLP